MQLVWRVTRASALISLASVFGGCSDRSEPRIEPTIGAQSHTIVGGASTSIEDWPGVVFLATQGRLFCGGAVVAPSWVVTAAHCVDEPITALTVVIGRDRISAVTTGEEALVKRTIVHEDYEAATNNNDLALLQLQSPTDRIPSRIATPAEWATLFEMTPTVSVLGWGRTVEMGTASDSLQKVSMPVLDQVDCVRLNAAEKMTVTDNMFCAATFGGGKDSCQGDSGGPVYAMIGGAKVQVGLVSWGIGCGRTTTPGVYTRVASYLDWMKSKSNGEIGTPPMSRDAGASEDQDGREREREIEPDKAPIDAGSSAKRTSAARFRDANLPTESCASAGKAVAESPAVFGRGYWIGLAIAAGLRRRRRSGRCPP